MKDRADYLKECMTDPALTKTGPLPMDVFNTSYCRVCANRECSRSALNGMAFDARALNWKKDMFDSVPRAEEADHQYDRIREKRFLQIQGAPPPAQSWAVTPPARPAPYEVQGPAEEPPAPEPHSAAAASPTPRAPVQAPELENTPFAQGTMVGGPKQPGKEGKDVVIEPGGTFTFGGDE